MHQNSQMRPIEILMVEDNPGDARLAMEAFKNAKIANHLHWLEDGASAMAFLHKEGKYADAVRPDLILLDLYLPKKDGREILAEIKEHPELKTIPVVVMTAFEAEEKLLKKLNLCPHCYIVKPIDLDQCVSIIKSIEDLRLTIVKIIPNI